MTVSNAKTMLLKGVLSPSSTILVMWIKSLYPTKFSTYCLPTWRPLFFQSSYNHNEVIRVGWVVGVGCWIMGGVGVVYGGGCWVCSIHLGRGSAPTSVIPHVCFVACTVLDECFPCFPQIITSIRGCVTCNHFWLWLISWRSFSRECAITHMVHLVLSAMTQDW